VSVILESALTAGLAALAAGVFWLLGWRLRRAHGMETKKRKRRDKENENRDKGKRIKKKQIKKKQEEIR
jgi:hypothetical protein